MPIDTFWKILPIIVTPPAWIAFPDTSKSSGFGASEHFIKYPSGAYNSASALNASPTPCVNSNSTLLSRLQMYLPSISLMVMFAFFPSSVGKTRLPLTFARYVPSEWKIDICVVNPRPCSLIISISGVSSYFRTTGTLMKVFVATITFGVEEKNRNPVRSGSCSE